jgi:arginase
VVFGTSLPQVVVIDAPSNLGLRPPAPGVVPGVYKLAGALRDQRLVDRLGARVGGVVTPPRYEPEWEPEERRCDCPLITAAR